MVPCWVKPLGANRFPILPSHRCSRFGQTEVEDLHQAFLVDHHVVGLEISVDDLAFMRCAQAIGQRDRNPQELSQRQGTASQPLGQRFPSDQLHGEEVEVVDFIDRMHRHDIRMS